MTMPSWAAASSSATSASTSTGRPWPTIVFGGLRNSTTLFGAPLYGACSTAGPSAASAPRLFSRVP
jgi:hypothetical protein